MSTEPPRILFDESAGEDDSRQTPDRQLKIALSPHGEQMYAQLQETCPRCGAPGFVFACGSRCANCGFLVSCGD